MPNIDKSIQILIPAYKAESELKNFLPDLLTKIPKENITVVIDGIFDKSPQICADFGVKVVTHEQNKGKGAALISGFKSMDENVKWVITMDADGQHSPDDLRGFLEKITSTKSDTAIILGQRKRSLKLMPPARIFSNWATSSFVSFITKQKVADSQCGYRAYRLEAVLSINCKFLRFEMETECILRLRRAGFFVENQPIKTLYTAETSHISHFRDTVRWIKAVLSTIKDTKQKVANE